jgi:transposase
MPRERATEARKKEVIPMKKKSYKIADVKNIRLPDVKAALSTSKRAVFGIDVAKSEVVVSIGGDDAESIVVFKVKQPAELPLLLEIATELRTAGYEVELAAESTGTYSDVLVYQARQRKLPVFRVSTKFVHDAKEIHDGVSSKHDAKDATLILWLHVQGKSRPWLLQEESQRRAKAVVSRREIYVHAYVANAGRLEALLARHWPELLALGAAIGVLLLKLLVELPSPQRITANVEQAKRLLHRHRSAEKMDAVVASAATSQGVAMIEEEEIGVSELAKQMLAQWREIERIDKELRELLQRDPVAVRLAALIGPTTAMVLAADLGDLCTYANPRALEKACGLNLREDSSGKRKSGLHITKRGPSRVRQYLYLAALRLLKLDPIVRAWYASRVARGQPKMSAVIAVLRKLVRSLIFVARGEEFQAKKLFDVRRLDLQQGAKVDVEPTLAEVLQLDETSVSERMDTAPEAVPAAPEEHPQASPHVPRNAGVARKNERAPSPSKRVSSRAAAPRIELAKRGEGAPKAASTAPQDTDSQGATMHPTGRSLGRAMHEEAVKVSRGARNDRPAPPEPIERAVP